MRYFVSNLVILIFCLALLVLKMKNIRKYTLTGISVLLLLCFSVTVLPADFFHQHSNAGKLNSVCKNAQGEQCNHKSHIGNPTNFCWVCAIHFDKSFSTEAETKGPQAWFGTVAKIAFVKLIFDRNLVNTPLLRGPPAA